MKTIQKYPLSDFCETISMPQGAQVLTVESKGGGTFVWALVDTDKPMEKRTFATIGTGHDAGKYDGELIYINTLFKGVFVWHIFEVK